MRISSTRYVSQNFRAVAICTKRYLSNIRERKIFVLNCGSSSIKYQLVGVTDNSTPPHVYATGVVERIGEKRSPISHNKVDVRSDCAESTTMDDGLHDHTAGLVKVTQLVFPGGTNDTMMYAIGHRVVHGGETLTHSVVIDDSVKAAIKDAIPLAPLHNPGNLQGIEVAQKLFPSTAQVACFDTSFHSSMPDYAYIYPIDYNHYTKDKIRRYGFHGTSHQYVANRAAELIGKPLSALNMITLHVGNGASAAAIKEGRVIDTSMGLTPLEGLMMGTRCGDIDPSIHGYLLERGYSETEIEQMLTKNSGLKGISGLGDFRDVVEGHEKGDKLCTLAFKMYAYRLHKYIGAYLAVLGGEVDAIVFTAGVGENSSALRHSVCNSLRPLGVSLDPFKNQQNKIVDVTADDSRTKIFIIPTNEEAQIAYECLELIG
eukprot:CFRG3196T1